MPDANVKQISAAAVATVAMVHDSDAADKLPGVAALIEQLADSDIEVSRAAKRELWRIVRHVGQPDTQADRRSVVAQLQTQLKPGQPAIIYREALWMLSEIGTGDSVPAIAALLSNTTAREDARMSLERIPGDESLAALKSALAGAPDDFKLNLAQSLRARGTQVAGLPCVKLIPTDTRTT